MASLRTEQSYKKRDNTILRTEQLEKLELSKKMTRPNWESRLKAWVSKSCEWARNGCRMSGKDKQETEGSSLGFSSQVATIYSGRLTIN